MPSFACLNSGLGFCELAAKECGWWPMWGLSDKKDEDPVRHFYLAYGQELYGYRPYVVGFNSELNIDYNHFPIPSWLHINRGFYKETAFRVIKETSPWFVSVYLKAELEPWGEEDAISDFYYFRTMLKEMFSHTCEVIGDSGACLDEYLIVASNSQLRPPMLPTDFPEVNGLHRSDRLREYLDVIGVPHHYPLPSDYKPLLRYAFSSTPPKVIKAIADSFSVLPSPSK